MADKKITELPYIDTLSGSLVGTNTPLQNTVIPLVLRGNTNQINIENFSKFVTAYSATTGSNTFIGNQTITGNTTIGGTLVVAGKITAQEFFTEITSASIIFESGSSLFGNSSDDTHTFTGSMLTTGSIILNGSAIGTGQLNVQTASQDLVNRGISSVTGSMNTQSSSQDLVNRQISSTTGSINTTTSSFDSVFLRISSTTGSINTTTSSFDSVFLRISSTTGSINTTTSSFDSVFLRISSTTGSVNTTTSSFDSVFLGISSVTGAMNTQSSSQDLVNRQISSTTGSINTTTSSFDSVFLRISSTTGSINTTTSSFNSELGKIGSTTSSIHFTTQSLNIQTGSQGNLNAQIGISTSSLNFTTASLNSFTGSIISQTNTIATFTSSVNFATQSLNTQTGSQDLVNLRISSTTGSINTTTSSFNSVFLGISSVTGAINTQSSSQDLVNYQNSIVTSSFRNEIGGIEAYTASLKSAIIVNGTNVRIIGELTASRIYTEFITSSVLFVTGSNIIGDQSTDKHEFTGSVNLQDTLFIKGQAIGLGELNAQTASQDLVNRRISSTTGSINTTTSSFDSVFLQISSTTGSINTTTSSFNTEFGKIGSTTSSIHFTTSSLNIQTGSQDLVNTGISSVTGSINTTTSSFNSVFLGISSVTGAMNTQTGSQDLVNLGISTFTGSLRSEVNLIEAYTASLKGAIEVSGQNVNVLGMITAQQFNVTYVSSSVMYKSGSTEFGDSSDDRHLFTGSLIVSGTLAAGTDETGWGRISFNESTNTLRIQSSKNGTDCIPISFWSQRPGGGFAESVAISGSNLQVRSAGKLEVLRSDNTRSGSFYCDNLATIIEASTDPIRISSPERVEIYTAGVERIRVLNDGGISATGAITASNFRISTAGGGIDFSVTSNGSGTTTSELLNDYEEGTWTPTYTGTNITITSYGNRNGYYTKIGRLVTITFNIMTEAVSVIGSENVNIEGLPFAAANVTENANAVNIFDNSRWTSTPPVGGSIAPGTSTIQLNSNIGNTGAGQDPTRVVSSNMATGAGNRNMVRATATYFTA